MLRRFPNVSIVGLHSFSNPKMAHERVAEDDHVVIPASCKRTIDPDDVACLNTNAHLVPQSSFLGKFVAGKHGSVVLAFEISAITGDKAVGASVSFKSIFPCYLESNSEVSERTNNETNCQQCACYMWFQTSNRIKKDKHPFCPCVLVRSTAKHTHLLPFGLDFHKHEHPQQMLDSATFWQMRRCAEQVPQSQEDAWKTPKKFLEVSDLSWGCHRFERIISPPNCPSATHNIFSIWPCLPLSFAHIIVSHCWHLWIAFKISNQRVTHCFVHTGTDALIRNAPMLDTSISLFPEWLTPERCTCIAGFLFIFAPFLAISCHLSMCYNCGRNDLWARNALQIHLCDAPTAWSAWSEVGKPKEIYIWSMLQCMC